jgi:hypothetical protein
MTLLNYKEGHKRTGRHERRWNRLEAEIGEEKYLYIMGKTEC